MVKEEKFIVLSDAVPDLDNKKAPSITVQVEMLSDSDSDGVCIANADDVSEYRICVENCHGKLICHVWATSKSIGNDPTHSIEIEPQVEEKESSDF